MVLGVGSYALSRKGAIVKRLRAAETLGNVTVIATDKTAQIQKTKCESTTCTLTTKTAVQEPSMRKRKLPCEQHFSK
jgi:magnesium-transporting ATPase (P-type)